MGRSVLWVCALSFASFVAGRALASGTFLPPPPPPPPPAPAAVDCSDPANKDKPECQKKVEGAGG